MPELTILSVMLTVALVILGLLIAIGVVVYKDAQAHDMQAGLWAMIAVLVPNFIGVIIYLIVRSNQEKKYQCSNCQEEVQKDYNVCPNCQAVFGERCKTCKHAISGPMSYCPYCGGEVEMDKTATTAHKVSKKTNIAKPLSIIGGIFITLLVIVVGSIVPMIFSNGEVYRGRENVKVMCIENDTLNRRKASFKYKDGNSRIKVKKEIGEDIVLDTKMSLTEGNLELTLLDPNNNSIYNHIYTGENAPALLTFPAKVQGKYILKIEINQASGSYNIKLD